jgi:hypothetical protein
MNCEPSQTFFRKEHFMVGKRIAVFAATLLMALAVPAMGQNNGGGQQGGGPGGGGPGGGGPGGGGPGGGRPNFQQMMQRRMEQLKQALGATDDEFAAIQPKIEAVQTLQRDLNGGRFGMFGGNRPRRGGQDGGNNPQGGATTQPSGVQAAMTDLENTLNDQSAGADQIKTKLDTLREARTKAKQDLAQAQQDLKSVLTQRQEAVMVLQGFLD